MNGIQFTLKTVDKYSQGDALSEHDANNRQL